MTGIVILNYNNVADTLNCVKSVYKYCDAKSFSICVVDNNSKAAVIAAVRKGLMELGSVTELNVGDKAPESMPSLTYLINRRNAGYAQGNNCGLNYFKQYKDLDYYLILNSDVILTEDLIAPLTNYLAAHEDVGVASPLLYGRTGNIDYNCARHEKSKYNIFMRTLLIGRISKIPCLSKKSEKSLILLEHPEYLNKKEVDIELPSGSCMMFKRDVFERIGFFDPVTFLYFEEDIIWAKLKALHIRCVLLPQLSCIHLGEASIGSSYSKVKAKSYTESLLYYVEKYSNFPSWFINLIKLNSQLLKIKYLLKPEHKH